MSTPGDTERPKGGQGPPQGPRKGRRGGRGKRRPRGGGPSGQHEALTVADRARHAIEALEALARSVVEERGFGPREPLPVEGIELPMRVAVGSAAGRIRASDAAELAAAVSTRIDAALRAAGAFEQGRVYCFLCDEARCKHNLPPDEASTFSGYSPHGKPEWTTLTNLAIARQDPRVDKLFGDRPEIIALVQQAGELADGLLPGFGAGDMAYRVLGQVVAGYVPADLYAHGGRGDRRVITLQLVETRTPVGGARLRLNLLGLSIDEIAEAAASDDVRGPAEALRRTIRATRHRIDSIGRQAARREADVDEMIPGLLSKLRGDVERVFRPVTSRRTRHAQDRHLSGDRPTGAALDDATAANSDQLLIDNRRGTIIVLGGRGRAHVFTPAGKHVTSLRLEPGELERKTERKRWTPLMPTDAATFRALLEA